jgi:ABC-type sugar transport system ATPase subunit
MGIDNLRLKLYEALSNLDAALRAETRVEISKLHKQIKTNMIYVTHDQVEAMTLADRIVILNLGNIEQVGSPDEIYSNPSNIFVAQFIGTPKMNILKVSEKDIISSNEVKFLGNNIKFNKMILSKKDYYFGIRPEHFTVFGDCEYKFKPKIDLTENLGNEKIAYIKIDGHDISAKIPTQNNAIDQIGFNTKNIFVFDENGERVRS